ARNGTARGDIHAGRYRLESDLLLAGSRRRQHLRSAHSSVCAVCALLIVPRGALCRGGGPRVSYSGGGGELEQDRVADAPAFLRGLPCMALACSRSGCAPHCPRCPCCRTRCP